MNSRATAWTAVGVFACMVPGYAGDLQGLPPVNGIQDPAVVLRQLVGDWSVQAYPSGGTELVLVSTRSFRETSNELLLEWDERFHESSHAGHGFLGYDGAVSRFYLLGAYAESDTPVMFLSGELSGSSMRWVPVAVDGGRTSANRLLIESQLTDIGRDTMTWRAYDDRWAFLMVRQ